MAKTTKYSDIFSPDIEKGLNDLISHFEKLEQVGVNSVKSIKKEVQTIPASNKDAVNTFKQYEATIESLKKEIDSLREATNKLKEKQKENKIVTDEERKAKILSAEASRQKNKEIKNEILLEKSAKDSINAKRLLLERLREEYRKSSAEVRKGMLPQIQALDKEVKKLNADIGNHQANVGNYKSAFEGLKTTFFAVTGVLASVGLSMATFKGIMNSTEAGADKLKAITTGLEFSFKALFKTISLGDWSNLISNLSEAYDRGKAYSEGLDLLSKRQAALNYYDAKQQIEMSKLEEDLKDVSKSNKDRLDAGEKWMKMSEAEYERRKILAAQSLDVEAKAIKIGKLTLEQKKALISMMLEEDAKNEDLRENAENYNKELIRLEIEKSRIAAMQPNARMEIYQNDIDFMKKQNQLELDNWKNRTDNTAKFAKILRDTEGKVSSEQLENIKRALTDKLKAEYAWFQENKRIIGTYKSQIKTMRDAEEKALEDKQKAEEEQYKRIMELERMKVEAYELGVFKEMSLERLRYLDEIRNLQKTYKDKIELNRALEYAEKIHNDKIFELSKDLKIKQDSLEQDSLSKRTKDAEDMMTEDIKNRNKAYEFEKEQYDKKKKAEEERREEEKAALKEVRDYAITQAVEALNKKAEKEVEMAEKSISATEKQIEIQQDLAAKGLENTLKFEQEQNAKSVQQKLDAEKKKAQAEKISAFWSLVSSSSSIMEAITKFGIGTAFEKTIMALPAFKEGVVDFKGKGTKTSDSNIVRISKGESIINANATSKFKPELQMMNEGKEVFENYMLRRSLQGLNFTQLVEEQRQTRKAIEENLPKVESLFDASTKEIINVLNYKNKKVTNHYKLPRL